MKRLSSRDMFAAFREMFGLQLDIKSDMFQEQQDRCFETKDLTPSSCNRGLDNKKKLLFFTEFLQGTQTEVGTVHLYVFLEAVIKKNCN